MAKPIEYITELNEEEARELLRTFDAPNPARDKMIAEAMALRETFKKVK